MHTNPSALDARMAPPHVGRSHDIPVGLRSLAAHNHDATGLADRNQIASAGMSDDQAESARFSESAGEEKAGARFDRRLSRNCRRTLSI